MNNTELAGSVIIIEAKEPFVEWLNTISDNADFHLITKYSQESMNMEPQTYLVKELFTQADLQIYLDAHWFKLFKLQLLTWELDSVLWPQQLNRQMFDEWFGVKHSYMVTDLSVESDRE